MGGVKYCSRARNFKLRGRVLSCDVFKFSCLAFASQNWSRGKHGHTIVFVLYKVLRLLLNIEFERNGAMMSRQLMKMILAVHPKPKHEGIGFKITRALSYAHV